MKEEKDESLQRYSRPSGTAGPEASPLQPANAGYRIWAVHCPFTKAGYPSLGSFGSTFRPAVIIPMATWTRLCQEIPELGRTQFEVGSEG